MNATLMYVGIGAVLATCVAILTIAVLFLQTARRYVDLTERRLELLHEREALLLELVQRQGHALEESGKWSGARRFPRWSEILVNGGRAKNPLAAVDLKGRTEKRRIRAAPLK